MGYGRLFNSGIHENKPGMLKFMRKFIGNGYGNSQEQSHLWQMFGRQRELMALLQDSCVYMSAYCMLLQQWSKCLWSCDCPQVFATQCNSTGNHRKWDGYICQHIVCYFGNDQNISGVVTVPKYLQHNAIQQEIIGTIWFKWNIHGRWFNSMGNHRKWDGSFMGGDSIQWEVTGTPIF
jgi:hypothetical protein